MSPLFAATAEATEEAIYNAMFKATTVTNGGRADRPPTTCPPVLTAL